MVPCAVVCALLTLAAAGCRDPDPQGQAAVRDMLLRWHAALIGGDREAYMACYTGPAEMLEMEAARFAFHRAGFAFRDRYVEAYGREAWAEHQDGPARLDLPPESPEYPRQIEIRMKGDYALLTWPDSPRNRMYRVDRTPEGWKMLAGQWRGYTQGGRADADAATALLLRMAGAIDEAASAIGREGIDARRVSGDLAQAFQKAASGG